MWQGTARFVIVAALCAPLLSTTAAAVVVDTVTVGNPGNIGEMAGEGVGGWGPDRICGAVDYVYNMGKYEVTAGQYTEFLNAVAATDTYSLYNPEMWSNEEGCKIQRTGSPRGYTYSVATNWANRPVNFVSFWDSCRFANWLHNGQLTGAQGAGTTETGAYTLDGYNGEDGVTIQRNSNWRWAIPTEDEWYKAAYHKNDGVTGNYWDYPTSSDTLPGNLLLDPDPGNNANFFEHGRYTIGPPYYRTEVGAFTNSDSPYGTFDQGGNVAEWNETVVIYSSRGGRGGSYSIIDDICPAASRTSTNPVIEVEYIGLRVVAVPEPATIMMLALAGLGILRRR